MSNVSHNGRTARTTHVLQSLLVKFEENLEGSCDTSSLHFAPEPAFIAADTVHDASDVAEVVLELRLENVRVLATEEDRLVEAAHRTCDVYDLRKAIIRLIVIFAVAACAVVISREVRLQTSHRAQEKDSIKVDVLQPFGVSRNARDEALKVGTLCAPPCKYQPRNHERRNAPMYPLSDPCLDGICA